MNYKEVYAHNAFECKVWFGFNKPTIKKYLFNRLDVRRLFSIFAAD